MRCCVRLQGCVLALAKFEAALRPAWGVAVLTVFVLGTWTWRGAVVGFVPLGLCLLGVTQWRGWRRERAAGPASPWQVRLYCSLPLRALSRGWGRLAELRLPEFARPWVYGLYASSFGVDLREAACPDLRAYPSLADFFSRALRPDARPVDPSGCLCAPCDGRVLQLGPVDSCSVEQVKGVTYPLEQFLAGERGHGERFRQSLLRRPDDRPTALYQCILYLAPGDYHRFHSPAEWRPERRRHFAGELLSVSPAVARWVPGLFALNERAVYLGQWRHGFFSFTAVGATNVGSVRVSFDEQLRTNCAREPRCDSLELPEQLRLARGQPMGEFRMGSTIVLIFEAPLDFRFSLAPGQTVRVGQSIGCLAQATHQDKVHRDKQTNQVMSSAA